MRPARDPEPRGAHSTKAMSCMFDLAPGDVLSYSAGSPQTGPEGYRKLRPRPGLLQGAMKRWPDLAALLAPRTPMFINAYPGSIGTITTGISVDTYLSPRVLSRALQLAAAADKPVILCGQPLFLADALLAHVRAELALPDTLLLLVCGYPTPRSLERMLLDMLAPWVRHTALLQSYGVAEVDTGCMISRARDAAGRPIFFPRDDIEVVLDGSELLLNLRGPEGKLVVHRWRTGDSAERTGAGFALWNDRRLHPSIHAAFDSWTDIDWQRRTGYVHRDSKTLWMQLRPGELSRRAGELDHWDFARTYGFSWLDEPSWR
jgi:hypothetical protein